MTISLDHIHIEDIRRDDEAGRGQAVVTFRVLERGHPNSFTVPVPINEAQVDSSALTNHARWVFHHLMRSLSESTRSWENLDRPGARMEAAARGEREGA